MDASYQRSFWLRHDVGCANVSLRRNKRRRRVLSLGRSSCGQSLMVMALPTICQLEQQFTLRP
jgi:hypothetical protein